MGLWMGPVHPRVYGGITGGLGSAILGWAP